MLLEAHSGKCGSSIETGSRDWTLVFLQKTCGLKEISDIRDRGKVRIAHFPLEIFPSQSCSMSGNAAPGVVPDQLKW